MPRFYRFLRAIIYTSSLLAMFSLTARLTGQEAEFQLPASPLNWLNTPPISKETLTGKAAVLYFFEES